MTSANQRPLPLRTRQELVFRPLVVAGQRRWSVKDPLTLKYFQLREEEHFILQQLKAECSLANLKTAFEEAFAPARTSAADLHAFLSTLFREGLLISDSAGQGELLYQRGKQAARRDLWSRASNLLAIRFRGVDAEPLLARLYPLLSWVFHPAVIASAIAFVVGVGVFGVLHLDEFQRRLPNPDSLWTVKTLLWFALAIALSKVLHELGHGLTCRHVGGECHEIGVMLLVFTPCLYCNVTDTWMQPNKWRRAAVSAAGVAVELFLAAVSLVIWWNSQAGLLHSISFTLMVVCSLNSLLFNGNPLLRYDGYYVLADLLEMPNLASQSSAFLRRQVSRWGLGIQPADDALGDFSRWKLLLCYGIASMTYRLLVIVMILWFLHRSLAPLGLEPIATTLGVLVLFGLAFPFVRNLLISFRQPRASRPMRTSNLIAASVVIGVLAWGVLMIPAPHRVSAPALVQSANASPVYIEIAGHIQDGVVSGQRVRQGQTICSLKNLVLEEEIVRLDGERTSQAQHLKTLEARALFDESLESQLPAARLRLRDLETQLAHKREDKAKLTILAPADGVVLPPRSRPDPEDERELPFWTGVPLDKENLGCFLQRGQLVCRIGNPAQMEALLVVSQADVGFIRKKQQVTLQLDQLAGEFLQGEVAEIAELDIDKAAPELVNAGELEAVQEAAGAAPANTSYLVRVHLQSDGQTLLQRATGQARIHTEPQTVWQRTLHFLARTFGFELVAA